MKTLQEIFKDKTILVVDDEPALREPLMLEFESLGCKVFEASNGRDAFEIVKREKIDAVISDIRMPRGDGVELLKNIKNYHHEFPMVMLITGFSDLSKEDAYHWGAEAILTKPFDLDELDEAVARVLSPREDVWSCEVSPSKTKHQIERTFADLPSLDKSLGLGRGGMYVEQASNLPNPGDQVGVLIRFGQDGKTAIEGSGLVRWTRREVQNELERGFGIEFQCLSPESRNAVIEITRSLKIRPFIPKHSE